MRKGRPVSRGETKSQTQRRWRLKSQYGLSPEDYDDMVADQGSLCTVCGNESKLVIDHNHATGRVRGLLCGSCNTGLGMFRDNPDLLMNAIIYLKNDGEI